MWSCAQLSSEALSRATSERTKGTDLQPETWLRLKQSPQASLGTCGLSREAFSWRLSAKSPSETQREGKGEGRQERKREQGHLQVL